MNTKILALATIFVSTTCLAVQPPPSIQVGQYTLPNTIGNCSYNVYDQSLTIQVLFPKPFTNPPVVTVSQQVSNTEWGDTYIVLNEVTSEGFRFQRRTIYGAICNELGTIYYIAIGTQQRSN